MYIRDLLASQGKQEPVIRKLVQPKNILWQIQALGTANVLKIMAEFPATGQPAWSEADALRTKTKIQNAKVKLCSGDKIGEPGCKHMFNKAKYARGALSAIQLFILSPLDLSTKGLSVTKSSCTSDRRNHRSKGDTCGKGKNAKKRNVPKWAGPCKGANYQMCHRSRRSRRANADEDTMAAIDIDNVDMDIDDDIAFDSLPSLEDNASGIDDIAGVIDSDVDNFKDLPALEFDDDNYLDNIPDFDSPDDNAFFDEFSAAGLMGSASPTLRKPAPSRPSKSRARVTKRLRERPSPPFHAKQFVGKRKRGNDGKMWTAEALGNGQVRWLKR